MEFVKENFSSGPTLTFGRKSGLNTANTDG
jgi:hypothetical protein